MVRVTTTNPSPPPGPPQKRPGPRPRRFADRFWPKVQKTDSCWLWTGGKDRYGYGKILGPHRGEAKGAHKRAHRAAYEMLIGPIPDGLTLDHLCRVRHCVNPSHLEPVTRRENVLRGQSPFARHARVTHCPAGHAYDEANTAHRRRGGRKCRACDAARSRVQKAKRRLADVLAYSESTP